MGSFVLLDATPLSGPDDEHAAGTFVRGILQGMGELPGGDRPALLVDAGTASPDGFVVRRVPRHRGPGGRRWVHGRIGAVAAAADLVHLTSSDLDVTPVPHISSCHDLVPLRMPSLEPGFRNPFARRRYNRYLERLVWARLVLVPSQATAADLTQLLAVPPRRIRVIPYGAPAPVASDALVAVAIPRPYALVVADREPHTNAVLAIRALAMTRRSHGLGLVVTGVPSRRRRERLARIARTLGVGDRTWITAFPGRGRLEALRAGAMVALAPARIDGSGVAVLGAMARGLPVIASGIPPHAEILGGAGVLVAHFRPEAWAEVLDGLVEDGRARRELGSRARARASQFTWRSAAERTLACYAEALDA